MMSRHLALKYHQYTSNDVNSLICYNNQHGLTDIFERWRLYWKFETAEQPTRDVNQFDIEFSEYIWLVSTAKSPSMHAIFWAQKAAERK